MNNSTNSMPPNDWKLCFLTISILFVTSACSPPEQEPIKDVMPALGGEFKEEYLRNIDDLDMQLSDQPDDPFALLQLAENHIMLYIFGFLSREATMPAAENAFSKAWEIDSVSSESLRMSGIIKFLNWDWEGSGVDLMKSIDRDPANLMARHWYSLWLSAMGDFNGAMAQSDTILTMDEQGDFLIGRGSLYYFARNNEALRDLMLEVIEKDPASPWAYDWLGMAYCEMKDFDQSIQTYYKAFELSDGLAEVGGGLGHALGLAGQKAEGKILADFYGETAASGTYVPQVQRAFIHIGLGEHDTAIELLEEAYQERSWFIIFMQVEPWLDPLRSDPGFQDIMARMNFPD